MAYYKGLLIALILMLNAIVHSKPLSTKPAATAVDITIPRLDYDYIHCNVNRNKAIFITYRNSGEVPIYLAQLFFPFDCFYMKSRNMGNAIGERMTKKRCFKKIVALSMLTGAKEMTDVYCGREELTLWFKFNGRVYKYKYCGFSGYDWPMLGHILG